MADVGSVQVLGSYLVTTVGGHSAGVGSDATISPDEGILLTNIPFASSPFGGSGPGPTPHVPQDVGSVQSPEEMEYPDWFERMHIVPRETIAFGNILTQVDENYQIFNAYRKDSITLTSIVNNAQPGMEIPNVSAPLVVPPLTSILDPSSTFNPPVPVEDFIRALQDGLPSFDTTIDFVFSDGATLSLYISGNRISVFPFAFDMGRLGNLRETISFLTDVIESQNGKEQRISLRKQPRQFFEVQLRLDETERQQFQSLLFDWQHNNFGLPMWQEQVYLTAAASATDEQLTVVGADDSDFRVGGLVVVYTDELTYDVAEIVAVTDTLITLSTPIANSYAVGAQVAPLRIARMARIVNSGRYANNLERFDCFFEVVDNTTGALTSSTSGLSTYGGKILFDDKNLMRQASMQQTYVRRVHVIDNETGVVSQTSPWDRNKRTSEKGFYLQSKAEIKQFRQRMLALRGRQVSFWIPTFFNDLTVVDNLSLGGATMDVSRIEYTRYVDARERMKTFRIWFTDGTSLIRVVQSSTNVSTSVERLTLDDTWPAARSLSEIHKVEFFELSRLDTDSILIEHKRIGLASAIIPIRTVFDNI
jgi:hypothetical protein